MLQYATIKSMINYSKDEYHVLFKKHNNMSIKFKSILKILFGKSLVKYYGGDGNSKAFLNGTRGWEYPWALEQIKSLPKKAKILDCGCGVSYFPLELFHKGFQVFGIDKFLQKNMLSYLFGNFGSRLGSLLSGKKPDWGIPHNLRKKNLNQIQYVDGLMNDIPFPDSTFDAVTCLSVMEHIVISTGNSGPNYHNQCLEEMKRVLKQGGLLICTYDTVLQDVERFWAGKKDWGKQGWHYLTDIDFLKMPFKYPETKRLSKEEICQDPDLYIIPPEVYYDGYGTKSFERITSVGFVLIKE